jgi:hypothetical protein
MSNVTVSRSAKLFIPGYPYISGVTVQPYRDVFSGSIQIDYEDAELNGLRDSLTL